MIEDLNNIKTFLTPEDLAEIFKISKSSVYRLIEKRTIQFYKIGGSLRFKKEDIENYLNNVQIKPISK